MSKTSYIIDCKFSRNQEEKYSNFKEIKAGVPQDSVMVQFCL